MIAIKLFILALLMITTTAFGNELICDPDYTQHGGSCYKLTDEMATFDDALIYCDSKGGDLVSIHSRAENDFIAGFGVDVFIGLIYYDFDNSYSWTDGTMLDVESWEQNYPNKPDFNGNCVQMKKSGKWINFQCEWEARYVCKKALSPHRCPVQPDNEFLVEGEVYSPGYPGNYISGLSCTYELLAKNNWNITIRVTKMMMGAGDTIEIFSRLVADNAYRMATLSGNLTGGPKTFTTPKGENRVLVKFTSKSRNGGYWKIDFAEGHCPYRWINDSKTGVDYCYRLIPYRENFNFAKSMCEGEEAQLISIHNAFENKFINDKAKEQNMPEIWLGLTYEDGSWKWSDGSDFQYTNWKKGEPDLSRGRCAHMGDLGQWMAEDCNHDYSRGYYVMCYKR